MATTRKKAAPAKKRPPAKKATAAAAPAPAEPKVEERNPRGEATAKLDAHGEPDICDSITDGTMLADVAKKVGVSSGSLLTWLNASPERAARAREARKLGAAVLEEHAQAAIEAATDNFQLAKARELAHHLRWKASKLDPRGFGDKLALGAASDLPPLPQPAGAEVHVTANFQLPPAEAYAQMLTRQRA